MLYDIHFGRTKCPYDSHLYMRIDKFINVSDGHTCFVFTLITFINPSINRIYAVTRTKSIH